MNKQLKNILIAIGIPTLYAIVLRLAFGVKDWNELFSVMSVTFLFLLPTIVGAFLCQNGDIYFFALRDALIKNPFHASFIVENSACGQALLRDTLQHTHTKCKQ